MIFAGVTTALTDYQRTQITNYLDSPAMVEDAGWFDGKAFAPQRSVGEAASYINDYTKSLNYAIRNWNMLSSGDKGSAEGQALMQRIQAAQARQKSMKSALDTMQSEPRPDTANSVTNNLSEASPVTAPEPAPAPAPVTSSAQAAPGGSTMNPHEKQKMLRHLESQGMRMDTGIFDGNSFLDGVDPQQAKQYYARFQQQLKSALRTWNRIVSDRSKSSAEGQAMGLRVQELEQWGTAMTADYARLEESSRQLQEQQRTAQREAAALATASKTNHRAECRKFLDSALTPQRRDPIMRLVLQMQHGNQSISSPEEVNQHAQVAADFDAACKALDLQLITATPCWFAGNDPAHNPQLSCDAAAQAPGLIKGAVINHARSSVAHIGDAHVQSVQQFNERNGWLTYEGPVQFKTHLEQGNAIPTAVKDNMRELLASAGLEGEEESIWVGQNDRLSVLRAEVEKTAGQWPIPADKGDNYSSEFARAQIERWHADAQVHKAWLSRGSWKIHKNALGAILRRTLPGYVMFKLPDDPYCQLRSYTLTEQYAGAGKYEPASGVGIGYVRFQSCP